MTVFDLVVLPLIANAVQNAMVRPDMSLLGGVLAAVVLLILNAILPRLRLRWPRLQHVIEGSPTLLLFDGKAQTDNLRREGLDQETLEAALREHGVPMCLASRWLSWRSMAPSASCPTSPRPTTSAIRSGT